MPGTTNSRSSTSGEFRRGARRSLWRFRSGDCLSGRTDRRRRQPVLHREDARVLHGSCEQRRVPCLYNTSRRNDDSRLTDPTAQDYTGGPTQFPNGAARYRASSVGAEQPSVAFIAPAAGATISGSFSGSNGCEVTGTGIVRVVFFMDNTQLNTETFAPWQCTLDTRKFCQWHLYAARRGL